MRCGATKRSRFKTRSSGPRSVSRRRWSGITKTAAQYAAGLDRLMGRLGLIDPYVRMAEPPTDYPKMRRHLHPRYRFDPLPGFGRT
jgi:hypothetical protein